MPNTDIIPTEARIPPAAPTVENTSPTNPPQASSHHTGTTILATSEYMKGTGLLDSNDNRLHLRQGAGQAR